MKKLYVGILSVMTMVMGINLASVEAKNINLDQIVQTANSSQDNIQIICGGSGDNEPPPVVKK